MRRTVNKLLTITMALVLVCSAFALTACGKKSSVEPEITLNAATVELMEGQSYNLIAAVESNSENKAVTWTSDDTSVATVSATGRVKAVGKGVAIISATADDGELEAYCGVTVNSESALLAGVAQVDDDNEVRDYFKENHDTELEFYDAEMQFYSDGKLVIKNAVVLDDGRAMLFTILQMFIEGTIKSSGQFAPLILPGILGKLGVPAEITYMDLLEAKALPEGLWDGAVGRFQPVYDIETEFYWQNGKLVIEDTVAVVEVELLDEFENPVLDSEGKAIKTEVEKPVSFKIEFGKDDASGTTTITSAAVGSFTLDVTNTNITKTVEKQLNLGGLLFSVDADIEGSGKVEFYDSGSAAFVDVSVSVAGTTLPIDDFMATYTVSNGILMIENTVANVDLFGSATSFPMLFTVTAGAGGSMLIDLKTDNGAPLDIATFTITAEQFALLY